MKLKEYLTKQKIKSFIKKALLFLLNPRLLLCFGIAWLITNGWSYIMFIIGQWLQIPWMIAVSTGYLAFLWLPVSPEKLVTVSIAILLLRLLFPDDTKTLGILRDMNAKLKSKIKSRKAKKQAKRADEPEKAESDLPTEQPIEQPTDTPEADPETKIEENE